MVLLVERFNKLYHKLENHIHHHHHESQGEEQASLLQAFQSQISICVNQLLQNSKPGSEILSLSWIQKGFEILPIINKAFAKLVVNIDYPMSKWEVNSVEEYLNYSLCLMELLNSITSSISHLKQARLVFSHGLGLLLESSSSSSSLSSSPSAAIQHLKPIQLKRNSRKDSHFFKDQENNKEDGFCSNREKVIHQALMEIESTAFWVCGIILIGLSGDDKPYLEMRKSGKFSSSGLSNLDSSVFQVVMEKRGLLKEVTELNDSAASLASAIEIGKNNVEAEELQRRLEPIEKMLESLEKEVNNLFSKLLAGRNELLDGIRATIT